MPAENFTTYTEVDEASRLNVTANRVTATAWDARTETGYVQKDFGVNFFGNFQHRFTIRLVSIAVNAYFNFWMMSNVPGDDFVAETAGFYIAVSALTDGDLILQFDQPSGAGYVEDTFIGTLDTTYYLTIERIGTVVTLKIYSDFVRATLLDTLTVTNSALAARYLAVMSSYDDAGSGNPITAYIEDLDLRLNLDTGYMLNYHR